jgi:tRNA threonylcarbamoyl adenosine modification protein YeaZ
MLVLAIDTSSAAVSAAVAEVGAADVTERARHCTVNARGHGEFLAPMIEACLATAMVLPHQLGAIVAGTGPGPYTGLRVGLVTAAVMSRALGIPAYGICSLDGIAPPTGEVLVAADARRKEVYWARYRDGARTAGPGVARPAEVPVNGVTVFAGAGSRLYPDVFGAPVDDRDFPDPVELVRRAVDKIGGGAQSDPLTPLYLRRPDAVEPGPPKAVSR